MLSFISWLVKEIFVIIRWFQFERGFDAAADTLWETTNQGKLWKDIKHKYENAEEADD